MEPVLLVHGYSAESALDDPRDVQKIFGTLPSDLKTLLQQQQADAPIIDVNISRYVSLDDGVSLDDISLAFDRILHEAPFDRLLTTGFSAIIHSTGALVLRNWIRRYSLRPSPCKRIVHLAGANLGSGWAHIGETQLAKWLRFIGEGGQERGLAVLDGLELGSAWALDLHTHFLQAGNSMFQDYGVMEFSIVGSQPPPAWMIVPFRYGKEDGSDGVVRVSASNLNHNYVRLGPAIPHYAIDWDKAEAFAQSTVDASTRGDLADFGGDPIFAGGYYELKEASWPGAVPKRSMPANPPEPSRAAVPFAVPYRCAHSTETMGIVSGTEPHPEVLELIRTALTCDPDSYAACGATFAAVTDTTYEQAKHPDHVDGLPGLLGAVEAGFDHLFHDRPEAIDNYLVNPQAQYDRHAQVVVRIQDQHGKPVTGASIHFNSFGGNSGEGGAPPKILINTLFQDTHINNKSANIITFYLRLHDWSQERQDWVDQLPGINGVDLEIDSIDVLTNEIMFLPLRMRLTSDMLEQYIKPHQTTIMDIELMRLPSIKTFSLYPDPG